MELMIVLLVIDIVSTVVVGYVLEHQIKELRKNNIQLVVRDDLSKIEGVTFTVDGRPVVPFDTEYKLK